MNILHIYRMTNQIVNSQRPKGWYSYHQLVIDGVLTIKGGKTFAEWRWCLLVWQCPYVPCSRTPVAPPRVLHGRGRMTPGDWIWCTSWLINFQGPLINIPLGMWNVKAEFSGFWTWSRGWSLTTMSAPQTPGTMAPATPGGHDRHQTFTLSSRFHHPGSNVLVGNGPVMNCYWSWSRK